ncbi:MAG TPA: TPM domain-containing protein [Pyrinomonadaceae bacterium]
MKPSSRTFAIPAAIILACTLFAANTLSNAQESGQTGPTRPAGHVNDSAGVLDASVKERLENMLANLKQRGQVEFAIVTVKTTEGKKLYDYSLELARQWKIGLMQNRNKSLLLVLSTDVGDFFPQVSRGLRDELPDGFMGEMGNRMRESLAKGNYDEALTNAVQMFVRQIAEKHGFSTEGMDQAPAATVEVPKQTTDQLSTAPAVTSEAKPAEAKEPTETKEPAETPAATETTGTTADAQKTAPARQRSVRDVFTKEGAKKEPTTKTVVVSRDASEKEELDGFAALPTAERVEKLKAFIEAHPRSSLKPYAIELLVSAYATFGDEKLQAGDAEGGVAQFNEALVLTTATMSDTLFSKVISQIPINLYMRGQRSTSIEAARLIEAKVKDNPKRLLALAGFYLSLEIADEAARLGELAVQLAPDMAAAHQVLGAARHISLRLDEAASEYARAVELDPKLVSARRGLADLRRAAGKAEEALALYREQLAADPADKSARAGMVLSLFDLGKREEAESEMQAALKEDAKNLALLVGASYWYAAHGEAARAQELATKAIGIEPRYTWAHIVLGRALVAQKRPLEAERVLTFARRYGNFPTLDYELATALAASGFYEEAAAELSRSFTIKEGQIETRLAGRKVASAATFIELLAPERRAGIFQHNAADTEENARLLKGLLELNSAVNALDRQGGSINPTLLTKAREDFLAGEDSMRTFRQLYMANRLLRRGAEFQTVIELAEAAASGVEAAIEAPVATVAVMADELREARARAINTGNVLTIGEVRRNILANILRGRIEDLIGWALFNQDKTAEAITHLKRAISVLPETSTWWRSAEWHLGASLEAAGNQQEALAAYLKSYNPATPDPVRRAIIETLYRKVNGTLDGLDAKIGPAPSVSSNASGNPSASPQATQPAATTTEQPKTESNEQKPAEDKPPSKQP